MSFITLIIAISVLVFVHELGHFLVAKRNGVRVDEFAIGFPPRIWSWRRGETEYSLNLIPFGGYVKIFGENPDEESEKGPDKDRSFVNKNRWIQTKILIAGVLMNVLFAWLLLAAAFMIGTPGATATDGASFVLVTDVVKGAPAELSGLQAGDKVACIAPCAENPKLTSTTLRDAIQASAGKPMALEVYRGNEPTVVTLVPKTGISGEGYAIGVEMADVENVKLPFFKALWQGLVTTLLLVRETAVGLAQFLWQAVTFRADFAHVSGPVGIAGFLEEAREIGAATLFSFVALISVNLAVINLFPFPALDGGRLLFVAIEAIRRKRIPTVVANTLNLIGFVLLMVLMISITATDIGKLIH